MIQVSGIRNAIDKRHDAIRIPIAVEIAAHVLQADLDAESAYIEGVVSLIVELDLDVAPGEFVKKQRRDSTETGIAGPLGDALTLGRAGHRRHVALRQHRFRRRVPSDFTGGLRSGVNGTPTFFINGNRYDGSLEDLPRPSNPA